MAGNGRERLRRTAYKQSGREEKIEEITRSRSSDGEFYHLCDRACQRQSKNRCAVQDIHQSQSKYTSVNIPPSVAKLRKQTS